MTRGIGSRDTHYYRRVFTDAALLIDAVQQFDFVDVDRIAVTGGSQGGGIFLAAAALNPAVHSAMPGVPYLCNFRHSVGRTPEHPFREIEQYLAVHRERVDTHERQRKPCTQAVNALKQKSPLTRGSAVPEVGLESSAPRPATPSKPTTGASTRSTPRSSQSRCLVLPTLPWRSFRPLPSSRSASLPAPSAAGSLAGFATAWAEDLDDALYRPRLARVAHRRRHP